MLEGSLKHRCQSWGSRFWDGDLHEILLYNMRDILHWLPWCDPGPGTYFCSSPKLTQPFLLLSTPPIAHCCRSHTPTATATLIHSFVASRLDFCSCLYTGLPATRLSCLGRVLRSAARLIGRIHKYDHISTYMRDILSWLPARQRIEYRMGALVWRCLLGLAPVYLVEFCGPTKSARSSLSLCSADQGLLRVPFARTCAMQKRAFAVVGPSIWNGLPLSIRTLPRNLSQTFLSELKAVLFGRVGVGSASE